MACRCWVCASRCASALRRCASRWACSAFALCAVNLACASARSFCFCVTSCWSCSAFCCSCRACFCASAAFCSACCACVWVLVDSLIFWLFEEPVAHPSARAGIVASHHIRRMLRSSKLFAPSAAPNLRPVRPTCTGRASGRPVQKATDAWQRSAGVTTSSRRRGMHALRSLVLGRRSAGRGPAGADAGLPDGGTDGGTPPPPPPPSGVLFSDDFNRNDGSGLGAKWTISSGAYITDSRANADNDGFDQAYVEGVTCEIGR